MGLLLDVTMFTDAVVHYEVNVTPLGRVKARPQTEGTDAAMLTDWLKMLTLETGDWNINRPSRSLKTLFHAPASILRSLLFVSLLGSTSTSSFF